MLDYTQLHETIRLIYQAPLAPQLWPQVSDQISRIFVGSTAFFQRQDLHDGTLTMHLVSPSCDPEGVAQYNSYYSRINTWVNALAGPPEPGAVLCGEDAVDNATLYRTEFYNDLLRHHGVDHTSFGMIGHDEREARFLTLTRSRAHGGTYGQRELRLLAQLLPHLRQAMEIEQALQQAELERRAGLKLGPWGEAAVFFTCAQGRVVRANRQAQDLLRKGQLLHLDPGQGLSLLCGQVDLLRELIGRAHLLACGSSMGAGVSVLRQLDRRGRVYLLRVLPIASAPDLVAASRRVVAAVVVIPERVDVQLDPALLKQLYGLTRSETRLAERLASGDSVSQAAEKLAVSKETARTHLKHIFEKTSCSRQGELVALLGRVCALGG